MFTDDLELRKDYALLSIEAFFSGLGWDDFGASKKESQQVTHRFW